MMAIAEPEDRVVMNGFAARTLVIDDFLAEADADRLLEQIVAGEALFTPSEIRKDTSGTTDPAFRSSLRLPGRVGVELDGLKAAVRARFDEICAAIAVKPFPIYHTECSIVAHRDGDFYKRHIDTGAAYRGYVRVVSCVYYVHRRPRGFGGGELAIHPLVGDGPATRIEPLHNRLAVFASFVPHEVLPTRCDGGFADSRFSINCWLQRAVPPSIVQGSRADNP